MADDQEERTEEATQQRRDDFRKRGQVAQTRELASVMALLGSALILWFLGRFFLTQVTSMVTESLGPFLLEAARNGDYVPAMIFVTKKGALILAPLMGILAVMSVMATVTQIGLLQNEEALEFKAERIDPVAGFMRLFSLRAVVEGLKAVLKLVLVISVLYVLVKDDVVRMPLLVSYSVEQLAAYMGDLTIRLLGGVGFFMGLIAAADYFFQRYELEKQMRMTKQEVKEEHKSREGDPMIKARIRRIQREMANKRMMSDIPKADVIITNPTHIACAIQYDPVKHPAPILIAKGADAVAEKIKQIAREHNIPVMENKPLARTMFKTMKVGQVIPRELFTAIAQVLSYVFKLKRKVRY
jgi:flagellar biosynthesis protein FlhB